VLFGMHAGREVATVGKKIFFCEGNAAGGLFDPLILFAKGAIHEPRKDGRLREVTGVRGGVLGCLGELNGLEWAVTGFA